MCEIKRVNSQNDDLYKDKKNNKILQKLELLKFEQK